LIAALEEKQKKKKTAINKDGTPKNNLPMQANDCQTSWHSNASQCKTTIKCLLFGLHSQQKNQGDTAKAETNNQPTCANDPTPAGIPMSPVINNNQPPALRLSYPQKIKEK